MIQVGATDDQEKANALLARARVQGKGALASARPFTEKVSKGSETMWRARFAGLDEARAEAACKTLKRSGIACFTTRN
jgi:D-alanyl-D-alanine carboxypeptidase